MSAGIRASQLLAATSAEVPAPGLPQKSQFAMTSGTDAMRSREAAGHLGGNLAWFSISGEDRSYRHRARFCPANHMGENRSV
jgi:hypothetical protein